ncbi:MAG TPA: V-type ATP synthase subunit A, partial [Eubacteriaceae bacterium]|nr:V-type ATP synthase subunit A [Eubacteriaceae bacterium]
MSSNGTVMMINGPVVQGENMEDFSMREVVMVGEKKLLGEIIQLDGNLATIQVYEETGGLRIGEEITSQGKPMSVQLGPGMMGNMFDGIQRPLNEINEMNPNFIPEGIGLMSLDKEKIWEVTMKASIGDEVQAGDVFGEVQESELIVHRLLVPPKVEGRVKWVIEDGDYNLEEKLLVVESEDGREHPLKMYHEWPVRVPRPIQSRKAIE